MIFRAASDLRMLRIRVPGRITSETTPYRRHKKATTSIQHVFPHYRLLVEIPLPLLHAHTDKHSDIFALKSKSRCSLCRSQLFSSSTKCGQENSLSTSLVSPQIVVLHGWNLQSNQGGYILMNERKSPWSIAANVSVLQLHISAKIWRASLSGFSNA